MILYAPLTAAIGASQSRGTLKSPVGCGVMSYVTCYIFSALVTIEAGYARHRDRGKE